MRHRQMDRVRLKIPTQSWRWRGGKGYSAFARDDLVIGRMIRSERQCDNAVRPSRGVLYEQINGRSTSLPPAHNILRSDLKIHSVGHVEDVSDYYLAAHNHSELILRILLVQACWMNPLATVSSRLYPFFLIL